MDIFKLIFEHDLRLDQLKERYTDRQNPETSSSLDDFLKPDPTYSKFYITGTWIDKEHFGLNTLSRFQELLDILSGVFESYKTINRNGHTSFKEAVEKTSIGEPIILSTRESCSPDFDDLKIDQNSNAGQKKESIAELLQSGDLLLYKENAHHGFDLHLFSKANIYPDLFYPLKTLVGDQFRFFSINGKRIRSEQKFYFETWTLENPPHGAEEVFKETVL